MVTTLAALDTILANPAAPCNPVDAAPPVTNLEAALAFAAIGIPVFPVCGPVNGQCGCTERRKPHEGKDIGKAPRTAHGEDDATIDEQRILAWWTAHPNANVAIPLSSPQHALVAIDADSEDATKEVFKKGIPSGPTRTSGNGPAYLFLRPEGCPEARIVHQGRSEKIDVLSAGYLIVHGTHANGTPIRTSPIAVPIHEAPKWAVEILRTMAALREHPQPQPGSDGDHADAQLDDDEPPVELYDEHDRKRWRGETYDTNGGERDRSRSLFNLGLILRRAGMTRRGIATAVAERDIALGWRKYTDRRDAVRQYQKIADLVYTHPILARGTAATTIVPATATIKGAAGACEAPEGDCPSCTAYARENAFLRETLNVCMAEVSDARNVQRLTLEVLANPFLSKPQAVTLIRAAIDIESDRRLDDGRRLDEEGRVTLYRERLKEETGTSLSSVTANIKDLHEMGLLVKAVVNVTRGEAMPDGTVQMVTKRQIRASLPCDSLTEALSMAAAYRPAQPELARRHGGKRVRCAQHPDAGVFESTVTRCAAPGCGVILHETLPKFIAAAAAADADTPPRQIATCDLLPAPESPLQLSSGDRSIDDASCDLPPTHQVCTGGSTRSDQPALSYAAWGAEVSARRAGEQKASCSLPPSDPSPPWTTEDMFEVMPAASACVEAS